MCGGMIKYEFVANLPVSLSVKEFWKSANSWENYGKEFSVLFFWLAVYTLVYTLHSMRSRVYVAVGCPSVRLSVCLSRRSTAAAALGWFAVMCRRHAAPTQAQVRLHWTAWRSDLSSVNHRRSCLSWCRSKGVERPAKRCYVGLVAVGVQEQAEDILVPPPLRNCLTLNYISVS